MIDFEYTQLPGRNSPFEVAVQALRALDGSWIIRVIEAAANRDEQPPQAV